MTLNRLADAFYDELQRILSSEQQQVESLPRTISKTTCEKLKQTLTDRLEETKLHVQRVEKAFEDTARIPASKESSAMAGIVREAEGIMGLETDVHVMNAMLIASIQKVAHYEIASYGTLCTWADVLGYEHAKKLLAMNIAEELAIDEKLTRLSVSTNRAASHDALA